MKKKLAYLVISCIVFTGCCKNDFEPNAQNITESKDSFYEIYEALMIESTNNQQLKFKNKLFYFLSLIMITKRQKNCTIIKKGERNMFILKYWYWFILNIILWLLTYVGLENDIFDNIFLLLVTLVMTNVSLKMLMIDFKIIFGINFQMKNII